MNKTWRAGSSVSLLLWCNMENISEAIKGRERLRYRNLWSQQVKRTIRGSSISVNDRLSPVWMCFYHSCSKKKKTDFLSSFQWRLSMNILLIYPDFEFLPLKLKETLSLVRKTFQRKTSLWPPWIFQSIWDSFYGKSADVSNAADATSRFFFLQTELKWSGL